MNPETIVTIATAIAGVIWAIYLKSQQQGNKESTDRALAETQKQLVAAQDRLIKQDQDRDNLRTEVRRLTDQTSELTVKVRVISEERDKERKVYQTERDEIMMERGRLSAQMEQLQRTIEDIRGDYKNLERESKQLRELNDELRQYKTLAEAQKVQLQQLEEENRLLKEKVHKLEAEIEKLRRAA